MRLGCSDQWRRFHSWLTAAQVIGGIAVPLTGIAVKTEIPAGETGFWWIVLMSIQDHALVIFIVGTIAVWGAQAIKGYFGTPWVWDATKLLLEELRKNVFGAHEAALAHTDRVTLFRKRAVRLRYGFWPSRDWVCAVERSGHMTRRETVWFRAHDDGLTLEGVAGTTFGHGVTIFKEALPKIDATSSEDAIRSYAQETFTSVGYVKRQIEKGAALPRTLCGIIVEVDSKPWGVIVIDSVIDRLAPANKIEKFYAGHAKILGKLLARL